MTEVHSEQHETRARIVYWGIPGAGISANLAMIHNRLKQSNRGALRRIRTRIDPTVTYEMLPIELGQVHGARASLHVMGLPGSAEQAPTRKQLLDQVDGIVFVADSRPECLEANAASLRELVAALADYGRAPNDLPFVIQYNKCDLVDSYAIERLHREIQIPGAAVYEVSAVTGTGVLKTLTTLSKQVIRYQGRRDKPKPVSEPVEMPAVVEAAAVADRGADPQAPLPLPSFEPAQPDAVPENSGGGSAASNARDLMENAILAEADNVDEAGATAAITNEAQNLLHQTWDALASPAKPDPGARIGADLRIVSVGDARRAGDRGIRVPLVLGNDEGETITVALSIQLDPLLDADC